MANVFSEIIEAKKQKITALNEKLKEIRLKKNALASLDSQQLLADYKNWVSQEHQEQLQELDYIETIINDSIGGDQLKNALDFLEQACNAFSTMEGAYPVGKTGWTTWDLKSQILKLNRNR